MPGGSVVKNLPASAGRLGSIPGSRRSPGEADGNLRQYSCLGNPMDKGARRAVVCGTAKSYDLETKQQCANYCAKYCRARKNPPDTTSWPEELAVLWKK